MSKLFLRNRKKEHIGDVKKHTWKKINLVSQVEIKAHTFNPNTQTEAELCEFEVSQVYRVSSRTARATQRNPVLKNSQSGMVAHAINPSF